MKAKKCGLKLNEQMEEIDNFSTALIPCAIYDNYVIHEREIPWHWHDVIELILVKKGTLKLCCQNEIYEMDEHEGAFVNMSVLHRAWDATGEGCEFDSLLFHPSLFSNSLDTLTYQKYIEPLIHSSIHTLILKNSISWQKEALTCICQAFQCYEEESYGYELYLRARCLDLWYLISSHTQLKQSIKTYQDNSTLRIKEMMNFIHAHYTMNITLSDIAKSAAISEREALRCFKKILKMAPMQYLMRYRIMIAQRKIEETQDSITSIANTCGFDSPSYFTYIFKKFTSVTPKVYRSSKIQNSESSELISTF